MSARSNAGSAFPTNPIYSGDDQVVVAGPGMTLRDYFAARALGEVAQWIDIAHGPEVAAATAKQVAGVAYAIADAMLAERLK